jgi:Cu(I)/Ag(I) efflux system membrane fusion protein
MQSFGVRTGNGDRGQARCGLSRPPARSASTSGAGRVQSRSQGYVEKLYVRAQYDGVAAGQPLAELYVPDWLAAQEEWLALKASPQPGPRSSPMPQSKRLRLLGMPDAEIG